MKTFPLRRFLAPVLAATVVALILALAACQPIAAPPEPTATPTPLPTPTPSPVAPPVDAPTLPQFTSSLLLSGVQPQTYIDNPCDYLAKRWDPANSKPGTIVVPIMYHGVGKRANRGHGDTWTPINYFKQTAAKAKELGYETVTAEQVADFLENNAPIPERSMMMIVDDRRLGTVEWQFMPVLEQNDWTLTLGWITGDVARLADVWDRLERLHGTGRLDIQAHGFRHLYMIEGTPVDKIYEELFEPVQAIQDRFGARPVAFVWPGGNFTPTTVQTARDAGYRTAYTAFSRGPLMYNWTPLGKGEREMNDPLMVLPRYWAYPGMVQQLEKAASIGKEAKEFALAEFPVEAAYYRDYCGGELPQPEDLATSGGE
ncbi:MAG: polysaccharide deacetylase family protein [Caldilineales bacterium]|nr:polysaccharide deacetylase family protein [Caldilineales bacterium]